MGVFRALTQQHQVDLAQIAPVPAAQEPRSLADLLPKPTVPTTPTIQHARLTLEEGLTIAALIVLLIGLMAYLWYRPVVPASAPAAAPAVTHTSGDGAVMPSPLPAATPATTGRLLLAFAAPDGQPLGAIESTRAITPTAHYGAGWIQADVAGSGRIWLRAADLCRDATSCVSTIVGPDLAPRRPAAVREVPAVAPIVPAATEPPAPPPCAEAGIPGKMVSVCGYDDLSVLEAQAKAKWIQTYGGNIGIVSTPSPQPIRRVP